MNGRPAVAAELEMRSPVDAPEWDRYYDLRWRELRAPWDQPPGSEKDDREAHAFHAVLWDPAGAPVAIGRVHLNSPEEAQIRFMAVDQAWRHKGLGSRVLRELECRALQLGARAIVLNSRAEAQPFYQRHGYEVAGEATTLFGTIPHVRMRKVLL